LVHHLHRGNLTWLAQHNSPRKHRYIINIFTRVYLTRNYLTVGIRKALLYSRYHGLLGYQTQHVFQYLTVGQQPRFEHLHHLRSGAPVKLPWISSFDLENVHKMWLLTMGVTTTDPLKQDSWRLSLSLPCAVPSNGLVWTSDHLSPLSCMKISILIWLYRELMGLILSTGTTELNHFIY